MLFPFDVELRASRSAVVVWGLVLLNVASLAALQQLPLAQQRTLRAQYGFVPARVQQLWRPVPVRVQLVDSLEVPFADPRQPRFVDLPPVATQVLGTLLTSLFVHAGWMHLLGNMWMLWLFGPSIEARLGRLGFLCFYVAGGVWATACHWLMTRGEGGHVPVIGASGAVALILGAFAVTYPFCRVRTLVFIVIFFTIVELPALVVLGFWFLLQLVSAVQVVPMRIGGGVAWWAQIGGFAAGALLMPWLSLLVGVETSDDEGALNDHPERSDRDSV